MTAPLRTEGPRTTKQAYARPALRAIERSGRRVLVVSAVGSDLVAVGAGIVLATVSRFGLDTLRNPKGYALMIALAFPLWWFGLLWAGLYDRARISNPAEELRRVFVGVSAGTGLMIVVTYFLRSITRVTLPRSWTLLVWAFMLITVTLGRRIVRKIIHALRRHGRLRRRAIIVGADETGRMLAEVAERNSWEGIDIVGYVTADGEKPSDLMPGQIILGGIDQLWQSVATHGVSEVLVAPSVGGSEHVTKVIHALDGVPVDLRIASALEGFLSSRLVVQPFGDRPLVTVQRVELRPSARIAKRALDLVLGGLGLIIGLPIIGLCALAVRLDTAGPALFRQRRVGIGGKEFTLYKLRSMVSDAEEQKRILSQQNEMEGMLFKMRDDPRITRVGRFLRKTSLDELPQLFNVIAGSMSLVGPRPPLPDEVKLYDAHLGRRLLVKPGITGYWQVSGRNDLSFDDYVRFDLLYVQNWSIALDLYLIAKTIPAILTSRGAY